MGRRRQSRTLAVWMNGEPVGAWSLGTQARHEFQYSAEWLASTRARPLSLSLPMTEALHRGELVEHYFDNLLPDSQTIRQRAQSRFGAASTRAFDLLAELGRDCVGAVQLLPPGEAPVGIDQIHSSPRSEAEVAAILRSNAIGSTPGDRSSDEFRISIAGAQEKTALLWRDGCWHVPQHSTPTTHIFKQPLGTVGIRQLDLSTSVENEWLCAQLVRGLGLDVARCEIGQFEDQRALIVERFDRRLAPDGSHWLRLPQEDLCQATGTPPGLKYEADGGPGIERVMTLLLGALDGPSDRSRFFRAQIVFWLLAAIDGHAKNFSIRIEPLGRFRLTPLYDVISAYPVVGAGADRIDRAKLQMAMAVTGKNRHRHWSRIETRHWRTTAHRCGVGAEIDTMLADLVARVPTIVAEIGSALPAGFPAEVSDPIFAGVDRAAARMQ